MNKNSNHVILAAIAFCPRGGGGGGEGGQKDYKITEAKLVILSIFKL